MAVKIPLISIELASTSLKTVRHVCARDYEPLVQNRTAELKYTERTFSQILSYLATSVFIDRETRGCD